MIRVLSGGREHVFRALPITIGRDHDNDLPVDDAKLSRRHCRIVRGPEGLVLEDLDSRNGTFVNGAPVRRHVLRAGDAILIGVTPLGVEWDPEAVPATPPRKRAARRDTEDLERECEGLRRVVNLTRAIATEEDEDSLLRRIVDNAIALTGAEKGFLFLVTLHGLDFRVARDARGRDIVEPEKKISSSIAREAVESGRSVMTEDAGGDARFSGLQSVAFLRLRSVLCVPLKVPDGPLGAIYLENNAATSQFSPRDIPLVTSFGDNAAIAIAAARRLAAVRRREEQLQRSRERIGRLNARLKAILRRQSRELAGVRADLDLSRQELGLRYDYSAIVGQSEAMRKVLALLDRVIDSDLSVILWGESGTGKELFARTIHYNGPRRDGGFVTVNCAAIPKDLIEAELFGREKGAYTGADTARAGLFEQAHQGTIFFDEIGDMPLETQGKLLRVLENGEFRRLGGQEVIRVSVRTIAASHKDLAAMAREGAFREDLFYRLNGVTVRLPALRERAEDVPPLFDHFLDALCAEQEIDRPPVDPEVVDRLQAYPWPGNVRELRNEIQRLLALQRGRISADLLSLPVYSADPSAVPPVNLPDRGLRELVERLERRIILDTLRRTNGNKTRAAELLGLSRLGLRKKIERYGLGSD